MDTLPHLTDEPQHFAACCLALSKPLLQTLLAALPRSPALVLSVGSGSGLLEALLLHASSGGLELYGVEVASCQCPFLPDERVLRVPGTRALHADAVLASVLMFVYPRVSALVAEYVDVCAGGALEKLVWLGHRSDWADCERLVVDAFTDVRIVEGVGLPDHEIMVVATGPKARPLATP